MAGLKDLFVPPKGITKTVVDAPTQTDLLLAKLRDVQRPALTKTILSLEGQGAVLRVPPSNAVANRARVLSGVATPAPTKLDLQLVEAFREREAVEQAIKIVSKQQEVERNARQRKRIADRMPAWRKLVAKRVAAVESLLAVNRECSAFKQSLGSPPAALPVDPSQFVLLGLNDGVLLRDDAAAFLKSANNFLKAN